ncbi:MAG: hypothetical protein JWN39_1880 [Ilumatobacteraceae bacterium]|nr:hypothetical protein [Ilumatobacteraceae bacterium]
MKALAAAVAALVVGVTLLPVLLANGDGPQIAPCSDGTAEIAPILATIRHLESNDDYTAQAKGASASGAYQFLDSSWNRYGGYVHAKDAPPSIQDQKARDLVNSILGHNDDDVTAVPVVWYIGHLPASTSAEWNTVPRADAGNRLTPRQYQARWMDTYHDQLDTGSPSTTPEASECIGGSVAPIGGDWSLPGPRALLDAAPNAINEPHHDYPAWDWLVPVHTPIYAIRAGRVDVIHNWPHNWWTENCGTGRADCQTCGVGITIVDADNVRWTYCHATDVTVGLGDTVNAGEQILWSGDTGRSGAPHVHVEIRIDGVQRCPQRLIASLYYDQIGLDPRTLPMSGCSF